MRTIGDEISRTDSKEPRVTDSEARVLIVMTGGTICMRKSSNGLVPMRGFLQNCMAPRKELNDGTVQDDIDVKVDYESPAKKHQSLRTPTSSYGKRIR